MMTTHRPRLSIRWRLTLWNVLLLAAALVVLGVVFYYGLRFLTLDSLENTLDNQAAITAAALVVEGDTIRLESQAALPADSEQFARVWDRSNNVIVDTSGSFDAPTPNPDGVAFAMKGDRNLVWFDMGDDDVRILAEPVRRDGEIVGVIEIGIETDARETLAFAGQTLAISIPLILLFAGAGGWWLAGRALNPIDRITRTAAAIEERDLTRRIDLELPDDEVGRLADTFNAMLDRIEIAFSRQRQFTADAAHELRTPLALMSSQIDVSLRRSEMSEADRETLEVLRSDVERLARMADSLLSLARSDARGIILEKEEVDLPDLLSLLADQYGPLAEEADVEIKLDAQPATVEADHDQLIQVLVNLLDNALHHSPEATTITLSCRSDNGAARIWIADQGPGIPSEHLPHIFDRFYRVESDPDRHRGGIGLGLAISRAIIGAHGGALNIESTRGEGTTAQIVLERSDSAPHQL